jgi:hypothetical protein
VTGLIFFAVSMTVVTIGLKLRFARMFFKTMKDKLMWSSVLRAQIQTYFPTVLATLQMMRGLHSQAIYKENQGKDMTIRRILSAESIYVQLEKNFENVFMAMFKLFLLISLPFFSLYFIRKNKDKLGEEPF